ncbi:Ca2+-binding actin-bundling protein (actinin), alpha chain (EF-Hand protein superfamily), partial [Pseudoloma neurophilia]
LNCVVKSVERHPVVMERDELNAKASEPEKADATHVHLKSENTKKSVTGVELKPENTKKSVTGVESKPQNTKKNVTGVESKPENTKSDKTAQFKDIQAKFQQTNENVVSLKNNDTSNDDLKKKSTADENERRTQTQIRSFTKWVNKQLERGNFPQIKSVIEDFSDGISLMNLILLLFPIEISDENISETNTDQKKISQKRIENNNKNLSDFKKRDNLAHCVTIIESFGINLINIDADQLFNKNVKLTLGLCWSLILKSISNQIMEKDNFKTVLLNWCKECVKDYDIKIMDFSTSWKDGLAFNGILHHFSNDSFSFKDLINQSEEQRLRHAFDLAEKQYKIHPLLDIADLTDNILPDEKSIITYLSEYYLKLECMDYKTHLERGKKYMDTLEQKMFDKTISYDKLFAMTQENIKKKNNLIEKIEKLVNELEQFDDVHNLKDSLTNVSSLYGDLRTALPLYKSKEYETESKPGDLFEKYTNTMIEFSKSTKDNNQMLKQSMDCLSMKVQFGGQITEKDTIALTESLRTLNELKNLNTKDENFFDSKLQFLSFLQNYEKYKNIKYNTAVKLFKTYDIENKGKIKAKDMINCCAVLDIKPNMVEDDTYFTFDCYIEIIKKEFAKQDGGLKVE